MVADRPVVLAKVVVPGTYVGTTAFYDSATAAGTAATNLVMSIGLPALRYPDSLDLNMQFRNGLVVTKTGTPSLVLELN